MANNTYIGLDAGAWATGGNWDLGHKPASNEVAVITTGNKIPLGPGSAESIAGLTVSNMDHGGNFTNVTVTGAITLTAAGIIIAAKTGVSAVSLSSTSSLQSVAGIAGSVTVSDAASRVFAADFTGAVTLADWVCLSSGTIHSSATAPGTNSCPGSSLSWASGSSVIFTGANPGFFLGAGDGTNPLTITGSADLVISSELGGIDLTGGTVTAGNRLIIRGDVNQFYGFGAVVIAGTALIGPGTTGATLTTIGTTGTPTVTGFEPLYKVGSGSNLSNYGGTGVVNLPPPSSVVRGTTFGTNEHQVDGTAAAAGGAIVYWPPQPSRPESPKPNLSRAASGR